MSTTPSPTLTEAVVGELREYAETLGIPHLAAVSLTHPGFVAAREALDRFVAEELHGEMQYIPRTAEVRKDPVQMLPGARSAVLVAVPYRGEAGPIARYAQSADYHSVLHVRLQPVADRLRARVPGSQTLVCVDTKPVMERAAAALAGLGFIGKHGCVIVPGLGSYVVLGAVLTTAAYPCPTTQDWRPTKVLWDACGSCRRCLDACPTDAFIAAGELDPRRCISYLTIEHRGPIEDSLADAMGERIAGCDVCQEVCPYNATGHRDSDALAASWLDPAPATSLRAGLTALANVGSNPYKTFVKQTALRRIPRKAMRRNALLALGNRNGPLDDEERQAVDAAAEDSEPQVAAAARRARSRRV